MAAAPISLSLGMSASGMMPPPNTSTSSAPFSLSCAMTFGNRVMWAPESNDSPTASASGLAAETLHSRRMPPHPTQAEWDAELRGDNPLGWPDYKAPEDESVVTGRTEYYAFAEGRFDVMGGSMGAAHGEKVVRAYRRATEERLPMIVLPASGGARMQEGMVALIQMARTSSAAAAHGRAGLLQLALMRSPTTGGVYASYASLADLR